MVTFWPSLLLVIFAHGEATWLGALQALPASSRDDPVDTRGLVLGRGAGESDCLRGWGARRPNTSSVSPPPGISACGELPAPAQDPPQTRREAVAGGRGRHGWSEGLVSKTSSVMRQEAKLFLKNILLDAWVDPFSAGGLSAFHE